MRPKAPTGPCAPQKARPDERGGRARPPCIGPPPHCGSGLGPLREHADEMSTNIRATGCRTGCKHTWRYNHGPDRSIPGTFADKDDVRRCEHGAVWIATGAIRTNAFYCDFDEWRRLAVWSSPIRYRLALSALVDDE